MNSMTCSNLRHSVLKILMVTTYMFVITSCFATTLKHDTKLNSLISNVKDSLIAHSDLSSKEDICQMIALCASSQTKFSKADRMKIESAIARYPNCIVACDTLQFYLESSLNLAYHEFVKRDYNKALSCISEFSKIISNNFILDSYPMVQNSSKWRIQGKMKIKRPKKKRNWFNFTIPSLPSTPNDNNSFTNELLSIIPFDFKNSTYRLIISVLKNNGIDSGEFATYFLNRAISAQREDIVLDYVSIWPLPDDSSMRNLSLLGLYYMSEKHHLEQIRNITYLPQFERFNTTDSLWLSEINAANMSTLLYCNGSKRIVFGYNDNTLKIVNDMFGIGSDESNEIETHITEPIKFDFLKSKEEQLTLILDLVNQNQYELASTKLISLFNQLFGQCRYTELCLLAEQYEPYIIENSKADFYNLYALSESNIGLYNNCLLHYSEALNSCTYESTRKTITRNMGFAYAEIGEYNKAKELYDKYENAVDNDFERFTMLDYYGRLYSFLDNDIAMKYFNQAEQYMDGSTLYSEKQSRHYVWKSHIISNKYKQRECLNNALRLDTERWLGGIDTIPTGVDYTELGWFYTNNYDYEKAESCYKLAYQYLSRLIPEDKRMTTLNTYYANNLIMKGNYNEAISILLRLKQIQSDILGQNHIDYLHTTRLLLYAYILVNKMGQATLLYNEYMDILKKYPKEQSNHEDVVVQCKYYELVNHPELALNILKNALADKQNKNDVDLLTIYARFLRKNSLFRLAKTANKIIDRSKDITALNFSQLSEYDRITWQKPIINLRNELISGINSSPEITSACFEYSLFSKSLLFHTHSEITKHLSRNRKIVSSMRLLDQKKDSLNIAVAVGDSANARQLRNQIENIDRQLVNNYISSHRLRKAFDIDVNDILKAIGRDGLAVDFVRYEVNDTVMYGAFLFSQKIKKATFVNICNEKTLLDYATKSNGDIDFTFYRNKSKKGLTYSLIWGKLLEYFKGYSEIYFSTDGLLNQLGIEFLPDNNDVPISDKYKMHRVFHLADISQSSSIGTELIAIGVSDHNSPIYKIDLAERGGWSDLKGVQSEFDIVRNQFKPYIKQYDVRFILNDDAREYYVKSLSNSTVSTLHFATHGFYKSKAMLEEADANINNIDYYVAHRTLIANKESLSGIILREGNLSWRSPTVNNSNDDILTSDEIENLSFPNLKLTVLSACETGLGDNDGEGVWGLQRAFRIAGTKKLICSLCKIDDTWTSKFMEEFYKKLVAGESIYDSFQSARRLLYYEKKGDPKIWSSMVLIE